MLTHEHDPVSRTNVLALVPTNEQVLIRHVLRGLPVVSRSQPIRSRRRLSVTSWPFKIGFGRPNILELLWVRLRTDVARKTNDSLRNRKFWFFDDSNWWHNASRLDEPNDWSSGLLRNTDRIAKSKSLESKVQNEIQRLTERQLAFPSPRNHISRLRQTSLKNF